MSGEILQEKLDKGWLHVKMFFEVLGASEDVTKKALEDHMEKLGKMDDMKIIECKISDSEKVENPTETIKEAYSQIAEVEIVINNLENLLLTVMFFGPSSIEVLAPKEVRVGFNSVQSIANAVAEMMHRYAAEGVGGIVINAKK